MKTIRLFVLGGLALASLQACQKDDFGQFETTEASAFVYDDPELEGNDDRDNAPPAQTDFLFDVTQDTINLEGKAELIFFDEDLVNPVENLLGFTQSINFFEPSQPERKVASAEISITQIDPIRRDSTIAYTQIRFDFGHGSLFTAAQFVIQPAAIEGAADLQAQMQEIMVLEGTRWVAEQARKFRFESIRFDFQEVADDRIQLASYISFDMKREGEIEIPSDDPQDEPTETDNPGEEN